MSGSIFHPFVLDNAAGQETVVGIGSDSEKYGVGISSHVHVTGIGTFSDLLHTTGIIHAVGGIKDTSGNIGSSGKVLSSTGSGLQWIDPSEGSTANAVNVGTNLNSTNADQFVAFMGASSGNNPVRVDAGIKYNPSSNLLTVGSITGSIAASNVNSGTLGVDRIPSLPASKITSGQLDAARIPTLNQNTTGNAATATSATTAATVTTAAQTNITSLGTLTGLTVNGNIIQSGTSNYIRINGALQDKDGQDGDSGQVLSSTGNQINWINVGDISAGSASQVAVSDESSDTTCFPLFVNAATGNQSPKSGTNLTFNSSTGQLTASSFSGALSGNATSATTTERVTVTDQSTDTSCNVLFTQGATGDQLPHTGTNLTFNSSTGQLNATTFSGSLSGNAATATKLATARTISGASFDGTSNITLNNANITNGAGYVTANTQLSNEQVQDIVGGMVSGNTESGITVTYQDSDGTLDFSVGTLNQNTSGNAATATTLQNSRTIGGVSFNGSGNIDLPGVNIDGNQNTSGNSGSATVLQNARTIGGVSFDGSSNINLPGVNQAGNQNTSGNAGSATILANTRTIGGVSFNGSANINLPGVNIAGNQNTSGIADKAETARIVTDSSSAIRPILFIASSGSDNSAVNNTFASLKFSPTIYSLSYNPNTEVFYVNQAQLNKIRVSSGGVGNAGQVLTSGGSGSNMTWTYPVPSGGIIIWSGASNAIPSGWVLCDGNNSTPDLRDRFVVGAGSGYSVGDTGGAASVTLTTNQIPSHTHSYSSANHPTSSGPEQNQSGGPEDRTTFNVSKTTGSTGGGQSHENRPPYYALCYIMKT